MELNEGKQRSKFDEVERILREYGMSESDLEKLKAKRFDEISEEGNEILKNLEITNKEIDNVLIGSKEDAKECICEDRKESKEEPKIDDHREMEEAPREKIEKFLREKSLSQSFINTFLKVGFTDEFHRLLNAMGFTSEDTKELMKLWELEMKGREEVDSFESLPSSSNEYLSSDGLYLKKLLSKPLAQAIREIVAKKPFDPVEYLGHWLLNYKICEERDKRRKEFELELMIERERWKPQDEEDVMPVSIKEEEEEEEEEEVFFDDWSILNDEQSSIL